MRIDYQSSILEFIIGDIRDPDSVDLAMKDVTHVFHASALKQVPSCEFFPLEAIKTNTLGTLNSIRSAKKYEVKNFVLLSTDKAAYPINAMGMSKAMAEKIALSEAFNTENSKTIINITRYGNVMGSRGSVIPIFYDLAKKNKPLTLTDPTMTRFMMSLPQSVTLVDYALNNGVQGELFVHKAKAATVLEVAEAVSKSLNINIETNVVGVRGGEKNYETLVTKEEMCRSQDMGDYIKISPDVNYLAYNKYFENGNINHFTSCEFNSDNADRINVDDMACWFIDLGFTEGRFND